jgi:hypothetical protein
MTKIFSIQINKLAATFLNMQRNNCHMKIEMPLPAPLHESGQGGVAPIRTHGHDL